MADHIFRNLTLSEEEEEFYLRQIVLPDIGHDGQIKLKDARVCIVGLGGLGSPAALQLAAMGVGYIRLIDYDVVEISNLHRQHIYSVRYLGYPKVEVAAKRLKELNPNVDVEPLLVALNHRNSEKIINGVDVVIDGLDRMTPRYILNRACQKARLPYVYGSAIMTFGSASTIIPGETPCLECFQGGLDDSILPTCAVAGVHPSVLSIIASVEVSEAVRIILGERPQLAGKLFYCDIGEMSFEKISISRSENCPACGSNPIDFKPGEGIVTELCGREGKKTFLITPNEDLNLDKSNLLYLLNTLEGFNVEVSADLGITLTDGFGRKFSLLKSGVMIVKGVYNEKEAYEMYEKLVINRFGLNPCKSICRVENCKIPEDRRVAINCLFSR